LNALHDRHFLFQMDFTQPITAIPVREYLEGEQVSDIRHEYVDGQVYAMSGGTNNHAKIAGNAFGALWNALRGSPCRPFGAGTKIRVQSEGSAVVYDGVDAVISIPSLSADLSLRELYLDVEFG